MRQDYANCIRDVECVLNTPFLFDAETLFVANFLKSRPDNIRSFALIDHYILDENEIYIVVFSSDSYLKISRPLINIEFSVDSIKNLLNRKMNKDRRRKIEGVRKNFCDLKAS